MIYYPPLIDPPTKVTEVVADPVVVDPPSVLLTPGVKCIATDVSVWINCGVPATVQMQASTFLSPEAPVLWQVGSAAPYVIGWVDNQKAHVGIYDVGKIWSCDPPRAPRHVVKLYDADYYYQLGIESATEILFQTDVDTRIAFADTFLALLTTPYFPIRAGVIYRWRLNTAHRFVHFEFATASIASDREFTAVRRFEGFAAARKKALRAPARVKTKK